MKVKALIITAICLIVVGLTAAIVTLAVNQFNIGELTGNYISQTYKIEGEFDSIETELDIADVDILYVEGVENSAVCLEKENIKFEIKVENNTLKIVEKHEFDIHDYFLYNNIDIKLFLNKDTYKNIKFKNKTGDINILDAITIENLDIDTSTSDVVLSGLKVQSFNISLSTGDIYVENAVANNLKIKVSTGDVKIRNCQVNEDITIDLSTGDIYIENLETNGKFYAEASTGDIEIKNAKFDSYKSVTSTGDVELENVVTVNDIEIDTTTGSVEFKGIDGKNIYIETSTGSVKGTILTEKIFNVKSNTGFTSYPDQMSGGICKVTTSSGRIILSYE